MDRPRILVIDDEANARNALAELLAEEGYDIAVASNGREGLELVESFQPDVLLTDIIMPGMSGLELRRAVRGQLHPPHVVFMSSCPQWDDAVEEPWLSKPLDVDEVLATVRRLLRPPQH